MSALSDETTGLIAATERVSGKSQWWNLIRVTAGMAQLGIFSLTIIVWTTVLLQPPYLPLFTPHPLLNSAALFLLLQAILLLQPTDTEQDKISGAKIHGGLNAAAAILFLAALAVIEANKIVNGLAHLHSPHAIAGSVFYVALVLQVLVGLSQFWIPNLYGGRSSAKKVYKYHRMSGYVLLILGLVTLCLAAQTTFVKSSLGLSMTAVIVSSVIVTIGLLPRIRLRKLGIAA